MANELAVDLGQTGLTGVAARLYLAGTPVGTAIDMSQLGTTTVYQGTVPGGTAAGYYLVVFSPRGSGTINWNGTSEVVGSSSVSGFTDAALLAMRNNFVGTIAAVRGPVLGVDGVLSIQLTVGDDYSLNDSRSIDIDLDGTVLPDLTGATVQLRLSCGGRVLVNGSPIIPAGATRTVRFQPTASDTNNLTPGDGVFAVKITLPMSGRVITPEDGRGSLSVLPGVVI